MKKIMFLLLGLLLVSGTASASGISIFSANDCATVISTAPYGGTPGSLATLIDLSGRQLGCYSQDKLFSNFNYSGLGVTADNVSVSITAGLPGSDIHGFSFVGNWQTGQTMTVGFTIAVCTSVLDCAVPAPLNAISAAQSQMLAGHPVPNLAAVTTSFTPNVGPVLNLNTDAGASANLFKQGAVNPWAQSEVVFSSFNGLDSLISIENDVYESSVPEPMTMALVGGGLVAVGLFARKRRKA